MKNIEKEKKNGKIILEVSKKVIIFAQTISANRAKKIASENRTSATAPIRTVFCKDTL
ncbi:MAG: hypothetical protein ACLRR1_09665 [Alistipes shahii]|uniref:hypothetical protein n=1 Tax=Alistipes shahii TaxID=328814 RepID=UPI0039909054